MAHSEHKEYSFLAASSTGIASGLRVKLDGDMKIVPAGLDDMEIGITGSMSGNGTDPVRVLLKNAPGTVEMTAASAFAKGAIVLRAADGKVDDTGLGSEVGIAMEAATAGGDLVEVLPVACPAVEVVIESTNGTFGAAADLAAVKAEGEKLSDDVRAIFAALVAKGLIYQAA